MEKVRVFIADDSVIYRTQIRSAIEGIPWIEVQGVSANGRLALAHISNNMPDILILDLEMPELDGLQTLAELNRLNLKCKVIMFSSASKRGAELTMEALRLGASDFVAKPDGTQTDDTLTPQEKIRSVLLPKISALFPEHTPGLVSAKVPVVKAVLNDSQPAFHWDLFNPKLVVIGSSTGGPTVLEKILSGVVFPSKCPIVIAQHMPPVFTASFAERLAKITGIPAKEAAHGEILKENCIYLAPGDHHLRLEGDANRIVALLDRGPQINSVRPAVDPLFETAAAIFKGRLLAFVLTGMGQDGRDGAVKVKEAGGAVVIQDEASSIVFGMPGAVFAAGAFDRVCSPDEIIRILNDKISIGERKHAV